MAEANCRRVSVEVSEQEFIGFMIAASSVAADPPKGLDRTIINDCYYVAGLITVQMQSVEDAEKLDPEGFHFDELVIKFTHENRQGVRENGKPENVSGGPSSDS